ncbi:GNAT family N-acetyltransferase [Maribacter sp. CXY002]|uniref:GNAT family N-acetyltransferase n=1 Tax=Maribacter luteocoastalis TaxID=3407671 RepID=UPI003B676C1C
MTNEIRVRAAIEKDLPILLQMEQGVIGAERPFDPTIKLDPVRYYDLQAMLLDDKAKVMVAVCQNKIIGSGYVLVKKARPYLNHENYAYLGFMYTLPEFRGNGVNALIIDKLIQWSHENGFKEIRLTVYEDNQAAIRAYEKVGFKKHIVEMRIPIED